MVNQKQRNVIKGSVKEQGITLIALIITVIVLLILAGVTINLTLGENGIFRTAEQAARNYKDAENKELGLLEEFTSNVDEITDFDNLKQYVASEGVNKPKILDGMTPIKFNLPTENDKGSVVETTEEDEKWYSYTETDKQWANAQTEDGSMWVWIPRYAYRMVYDNPSDKSAGGTVDVVFLIGSTDNFYDADGNLQTAKRAKSATEIVDTTTGYTVHPAFTDETSIQFANGGWDEELTGIWVAKFEAAYADGDVSKESRRNSAPVQSSSVNYTQTRVYAPSVETGSNNDWVIARNYKDGEYAVLNGTEYEWKDGVETAIKYPTFQGISYAMNYISISDAYNISRVLTEWNNIYALTESNADSHLMKNSEWGAVSYLSKSIYGLGSEIYINNANLNNTTQSVYAVTGCCGVSKDENVESTSIVDIDAGTANLYVWNEEEGQKASTTGTIYGIYDMSGGTLERTSGYVANGNVNLQKYGPSLANSENTLKTVSTKYTTVYPLDNSVDYIGTTAEIDKTSVANYTYNTRIYGDAIRETSDAGIGANAWNNDNSNLWSLNNPFSGRGGRYSYTSGAGMYSFQRTNGGPYWYDGFRSVLVTR